MATTLTSAGARLGIAAVAVIISLGIGTFAVANLSSGSLLAAASEGSYHERDTLRAVDLAVRNSPIDSQAWYKRGLVYLDNANGESTEARLDTAILSLRKAAALSPEDWRIEIAHGQALSRANHNDEARIAFKRALSLAPNYYEPHWNYGNFLLRNGEADAAFAEFQIALNARPFELPLIFEYAWNTFDGDAGQVLSSLRVPSKSLPMLAALLAAKGKVPEGMNIWRQVSSPADLRANTRNFVNSLLAVRAWGSAFDVWKNAPRLPNPNAAQMDQDALDEDTQWFTYHQPDQGSELSNGDFEADLRSRNSAPFLDWKVGAIQGLSISRDSEQKKSGNVSLRVTFDVPGNAAFSVIEQTVPVVAGAKYVLSYISRTENMMSLSTPLIEVYDPADTSKLRIASKPLPLNTTQWEETRLDFTVPSGTEMVVVRLLRPACGEPPCPIIGKVWIDGIRLVRQ